METTSKNEKKTKNGTKFMVSRDEISNSGYELSLNRYKKIEDKLENIFHLYKLLKN